MVGTSSSPCRRASTVVRSASTRSPSCTAAVTAGVAVSKAKTSTKFNASRTRRPHRPGARPPEGSGDQRGVDDDVVAVLPLRPVERPAAGDEAQAVLGVDALGGEAVLGDLLDLLDPVPRDLAVAAGDLHLVPLAHLAEAVED